MARLDPETHLSPEDARIAEEHLRARLGEVLTEAERTELAAQAAGKAELLAGLERADALLVAAAGEAQPSSAFTERVMSALPAAPADGKGEGLDGPRVYTAARGWSLRRRPRTIAVASLAALVCLAVGGGLWWQGGRASVSGAQFEVARGLQGLRDEEGRAVSKLEPGQTYRVAAVEGAVLKVGQHTKFRLTQDTEFQTLVQDDRGSVRIERGMLYAHQSGSSPVTVKCLAFDASGEGVFMVHQEPSQSRAGADEEGWGQGIVLVFKGCAQVQAPLSAQVLRVEAGEMFVSGTNVERVAVFLEDVDRRAGALQDAAAQAQDSGAQRKLYVECVEGYQTELQRLETVIGRTGERGQAAELKARAALVQEYLEQHRKRLRSLSAAGEGEPPLRRARRLRRAAEDVRKGQNGHADPNTWM